MCWRICYLSCFPLLQLCQGITLYSYRGVFHKIEQSNKSHLYLQPDRPWQMNVLGFWKNLKGSFYRCLDSRTGNPSYNPHMIFSWLFLLNRFVLDNHSMENILWYLLRSRKQIYLEQLMNFFALAWRIILCHLHPVPLISWTHWWKFSR